MPPLVFIRSPIQPTILWQAFSGWARIRTRGSSSRCSGGSRQQTSVSRTRAQADLNCRAQPDTNNTAFVPCRDDCSLQWGREIKLPFHKRLKDLLGASLLGNSWVQTQRGKKETPTCQRYSQTKVSGEERVRRHPRGLGEESLSIILPLIKEDPQDHTKFITVPQTTSFGGIWNPIVLKKNVILHSELVWRLKTDKGFCQVTNSPLTHSKCLTYLY